MVTEHLDDGEGEILARVRKVIGKDLPLVVSLDLHANVTPEMVEHADALIAYRTYPHVDMADTGRAAAKHLALLLQPRQRFAKAFRQLPFLIPISWQCTNDQPTKGIYQKLAALESEAVPTLSFAPGFPAADFRRLRAERIRLWQDAGRCRRRGGQHRRADRKPRERFRRPHLYARRRRAPCDGAGEHAQQADRDRRHPGQSRRRRRFLTPQACCARWSATTPPRRDRRDRAIRNPRKPRTRRAWRHHHARARRQSPAFPATRRTRKHSSSSNCPDGQFVAPGPYFGGRDMDMGPSACLRIGDVRVVVELAQGAARRSGDVPLCRHRADRASHPRQQELGAFPRRFRTDRRTADDLRRTRRDARRYRRIAVDAAASGHSHQAERCCLCAHNQITFNIFCNRITDMPNIDRIEGYADELTAIRRDLHAHPRSASRKSAHPASWPTS